MKRTSLGRMLAVAAAMVISGNAAVADVFDYFDEAGERFRSAGTRMVAWWKEAAPISNETVVAQPAVGGECCEDGCGDGCTQTGCGDGCPAPLMTPNMIGAPMFDLPAVSTIDGAYFRQMTRVADNNSALPQDRISLTYNYVHNVGIRPGALTDNFHLVNVGIEKTLFDGNMSATVIAPGADISSPNQPASPPAYAQGWELGDIAFGLKALVVSNSRFAVSVGGLAEIPTADDGLASPPPAPVNNDAWKFTPYLALLYAPSDRLYAHVFASYRMHSQSNNTFGVRRRAPDMLALDASVGYWLQRSNGNGIAATVELHYNATFRGTTPLLADSLAGSIDHLYGTVGLIANMGNRATFSVGAAFPLRDANTVPFVGRTDKWYDVSLMAQVNIYFGQN